MKRKYEGIIVLNTKGKEESVATLIQTVRDQIEAEGASVEGVDDLGRRKFAYNARHLEAGYYVNYKFESEPDSIDRIQTRLKLNSDVFLQHYQRLN
jgi:small subunit ribosomal protein S6